MIIYYLLAHEVSLKSKKVQHSQKLNTHKSSKEMTTPQHCVGQTCLFRCTIAAAATNGQLYCQSVSVESIPVVLGCGCTKKMLSNFQSGLPSEATMVRIWSCIEHRRLNPEAVCQVDWNPLVIFLLPDETQRQVLSTNMCTLRDEMQRYQKLLPPLWVKPA